MIALIIGGLLISVMPHNSTDIASIALMIGLLAFFTYKNWGKIRAIQTKRKLVLDDSGLRYEAPYGSYSLPWLRCSHYIVRQGMDGQVSALIIMERGDSFIPLMSFDGMPEILAIVGRHIPVQGPQNLLETMLFNRFFIPVSLGLSLLGITLVSNPWLSWGDAFEQEILGFCLMTPSILAYMYTQAKSPILGMFREKKSTNSGNVQAFLRNLLLWVVIVVVLLLVFQSFH